MRFCTFSAAFAVLVVSLSGCGGEEGPKYVDIAGVVKVGDKPLDGTGFILQFEPTAGGGGGSAQIGKDGAFSSKIPVGTHVVLIAPDPLAGGEHGGGSGATSDVNRLLTAGVDRRVLSSDDPNFDNGGVDQSPLKITVDKEDKSMTIKVDQASVGG